MKKTKIYPKVLLVGRTNVGKSTLFNRLSKDTQSIVLHQAGVTRDHVHEIVEWKDKKFDLIDTGGISFKKQKDPILESVRQKVFKLFEQAALTFLVCDIKSGLTEEDQEIARILHKTKRPLVLLLNKSDNKTALEQNLADFYALGIKEIIEISALHGMGMDDLLEKIVETIPEPTTVIQEEKPSYKVVILGKPNVGKSSLMNILLKEERSIITNVAGTTREAISENVYFSQDIIQITDTAGVRKKARVKETIEELMVKSTLSAVRMSNIVFVMIDASEQKLSDQELKLLFYAFEQKKSIIIIFNKTDLLREYDRKAFEYNLKEYHFILKKIPQIWISCKLKKNIEKVYRELEKAWLRRQQKFDEFELNELIKEAFIKKPMYHKTILLKLLHIKQVAAPFPTFQVTVNFPQWFGETQLGFIENTLRKTYDLKGCPIQFNLKKA